jgi:hypothetical protein
MDEKPTVLVSIRDGHTSCATSTAAGGNVRVLILNWDELTDTTSRGDLCRAYKDIWSAPEDIRTGPLTELIGEVQRRFPIMATFHPQRFQTVARSAPSQTAVRLVPDGQPVRFDVTETVLLRGPDYLDNLRDKDYPTDDLADDLLDRQQHDGPFQVEVKEVAMEFLFADENEVGDAENRET